MSRIRPADAARGVLAAPRVYEPAFGRDLEWCLLHALGRLGKPGGESAYFRLSTRPIDQSLHAGTLEGALSGGYRCGRSSSPRS
jgi:pyruvate dehydrogenase E1 component